MGAGVDLLQDPERSMTEAFERMEVFLVNLGTHDEVYSRDTVEARRGEPRRGGPTMIKIWSELRGARLKEQVADIATLLWVVFWGSIVWQLFVFLSSFAQAGRTIQAGGQTMVQ